MNETANQPWSSRVHDYVQDLALLAETIDLLLDNTRVGTQAVDADQMSKSTAELAASIAQLEDKVGQRETLIRAEDAPTSGLTLREKLLATRHVDDARLAKQCGEVSKAIEMAHTRAISLFVCQYHLAEATGDIVRVLSGASAMKTYDRQAKPNKGDGGGGLFDEAA